MKSKTSAILLFLGSLVWFIVFILDYVYNKNNLALMYLLVSLVWWTCGLIVVIKDPDL